MYMDIHRYRVDATYFDSVFKRRTDADALTLSCVLCVDVEVIQKPGCLVQPKVATQLGLPMAIAMAIAMGAPALFEVHGF